MQGVENGMEESEIGVPNGIWSRLSELANNLNGFRNTAGGDASSQGKMNAEERKEVRTLRLQD